MTETTPSEEREYWDGRIASGVASAKFALWSENCPDSWTARQEACLELIEPWLKLTPGAFVADIGCGMGRLVIPLAKKHPLIKVVGIDISPDLLGAAVHEANLEGVKNVDFTLNDGRSLGFPENSMDGYYSVVAFIHMGWPTICGYFKEVSRTLKKAGRFRFMWMLGNSYIPFNGSYTVSAVTDELKKNGLAVLSVEEHVLPRGITPGIYGDWGWCAAEKT